VDAAAREEEKTPLTMINPKIISIEENLVPYEEGCLSFPEHFAEIERPDKLSIEYIDENNQKQILNTEGFTSRIIQHELDHLNGILFVDHLSRLKRDVIIRKMKKFQKEKNIV
jgi:peptide deformylase